MRGRKEGRNEISLGTFYTIKRRVNQVSYIVLSASCKNISFQKRSNRVKYDLVFTLFLTHDTAISNENTIQKSLFNDEMS